MVDVVDRIGDTRSVLLLGSPMDGHGESLCMDLLVRDGRPPRHVLNVLFTQRPSERVETWERHVGELPESFSILTSQRPSGTFERCDVDRVGQPGDLTGIGVAITDRLTRWPTDEPTAFCLHSLTAQLQFADPEQVYQFHHTLCGHLAELGVASHVHMNPKVHDGQTVDTFKTLFDAVVTVDGDGATVATQR